MRLIRTNHANFRNKIHLEDQPWVTDIELSKLVFQKTQDAILGILESFRRIPRKIKILPYSSEKRVILTCSWYNTKKTNQCKAKSHVFFVWAWFCILLMLGHLILWCSQWWSAESLELVQTYERNYPNGINWFTHTHTKKRQHRTSPHIMPRQDINIHPS